MAKNASYLLREDIYLIGDFQLQIVGNKLPTILDCLKVLFFYVRINGETVKRSASLVLDEVILFWEKAKIPTLRKDKCVAKLLKYYEDWRNLQKSKGQKFNEQNEFDFSTLLRTLFDISHANVMKTIDEDQKDFFMDQLDKRIRVIGTKAVAKEQERKIQEEEKKVERVNIINERLRKSDEEIKKLSKYLYIFETKNEYFEFYINFFRSIILFFFGLFL